MPGQTEYVIDASALIDLWRPKNYSRRVFPSLWRNFEELVASGRLMSVREARRELTRRASDQLADWVKQHSTLFTDPGEEEINLAVRTTARFPKLVDPYKEEGQADPFLIAKAKLAGSTVVTNEGKGGPNKPTIPYVCGELKILCLDLVGMFEDLGWSF